MPSLAARQEALVIELVQISRDRRRSLEALDVREAVVRQKMRDLLGETPDWTTYKVDCFRKHLRAKGLMALKVLNEAGGSMTISDLAALTPKVHRQGGVADPSVGTAPSKLVTCLESIQGRARQMKLPDVLELTRTSVRMTEDFRKAMGQWRPELFG